MAKKYHAETSRVRDNDEWIWYFSCPNCPKIGNEMVGPFLTEQIAKNACNLHNASEIKTHKC